MLTAECGTCRWLVNLSWGGGLGSPLRPPGERGGGMGALEAAGSRRARGARGLGALAAALGVAAAAAWLAWSVSVWGGYCPGGGETLSSRLQKLGLPQYRRAFSGQGYQCLEDIFGISEAECAPKARKAPAGPARSPTAHPAEGYPSRRKPPADSKKNALPRPKSHTQASRGHRDREQSPP